MNFNFPSGSEDDKNSEYFAKAQTFFQDHLEIIGLVAFTLLAVIIIIVILKIICQGALIKSIFLLIRRKEANFKIGFREGRKYFWKIMFTGLIIALFILILLIALGTPIAFLVIIKSYVWAVILGLVALLIFVGIAILASFIREYAYIYLVSSDLSVGPSIENAFELFRKNFWTSIIFSLLFVAVGIVFGLLILVILLVIGAIFVIPIIMMLVAKLITGAIVLGVVGFLLVLAIILLLQSVFISFRQASWILFFIEIASDKKEEVVREELVEAQVKVLEGGEA